jgi:flagellar hook-associated protein 3 FlgL
MAIRITQNQIANRFNLDVNSIYAKMAKSQQQLSDGRRITRPSDDPFGTGQVLGYDTQLADVRRFQENAATSIGFLNSADSALDSVTQALQGIREKATQAANGTNGLSDLQSIATEIQQLKEVVRDGMNAQHGDTFIFGGTSTGSAPYPGTLPPPNANDYAGNGNVMARRVGQNQSVSINVPGDSVMGPNGANTLDIIDQLVLDVQAGNTAGIQAGLGNVIAQTDLALNVRTQLGATTSRIEVMQGRLDLTEERLLAARTEVADVDATEAYMEFTQQQTMYQAALAAGTRIMQTSILDFI